MKIISRSKIAILLSEYDKSTMQETVCILSKVEAAMRDLLGDNLIKAKLCEPTIFTTDDLHNACDLITNIIQLDTTRELTLTL